VGATATSVVVATSPTTVEPSGGASAVVGAAICVQSLVDHGTPGAADEDSGAAEVDSDEEPPEPQAASTTAAMHAETTTRGFFMRNTLVVGVPTCSR
jgi:hypothetical protein